ncbi:regulator of RNase E activity RraA [Stackebrandtia albiflava]|uniref:Putative 4-hydroxy-4-methyl-2-oxoglutarate aldolase n=1 Tax=Stackebrandtia albiflava TaxID=406432 RepID=A0A562V581_9ACTN|nr:RraA family protein [Stackebrandtia albiflava]TWJ12978.1 regulator of RNase E activity RraA [Stackebrandtia albiflava]
MRAEELRRRFEGLSTAHIADGCLRVGEPVRCAPPDTTPVSPGVRLAGRVRPVRHCGSVDVFLEALERSDPGDVLVVDNAGRLDEACVGDLVVWEAAAAGLSGVVIWGLHRDTADIREIGLPVFSLGALPTGPLRLDDRPTDALVAARSGDLTVTEADLVFGDDDGVVFVSASAAEAVSEAAARIAAAERSQVAALRAGRSLREQLAFSEFLARRAAEPDLTFRQHLRARDGAIEE